MTESNANQLDDAFTYAKREIVDARYRRNFEVPSPTHPGLTWSQALETVITSDRLASLEFNEVCDIKSGAFECPDTVARDLFLQRFGVWQAAQWPRFRESATLQAISRVGRTGAIYGDLKRSVFEWPQLRAEAQVRQEAILHAIKTDYRIDEAVSDLALFDGSVELLRPILDRVIAAGLKEVNEAMTRLITCWVGPTPWGKLFGSLLTEMDAGVNNPDVASVMRLMAELPMDLVTRKTSQGLRRLSGATRTAWRSLLLEAVANDHCLRDAVTEAVLWLASDGEDKFAQLTALHLNLDNAEEAMARLANHPSLRVRMRARAAMELASGNRDPVENMLLTSKETATPWSSRLSARTWLNDPRLEQLLINGFTKATESLADEVRSTASAGEETLVAKLFERLKNSVENIGQMTRAYARETDKREYLHVELDHRFIGKAEEGAEGLNGSSSFSTDVTLIMRGARPNGTVFAERSVFLQAKRMYRGKSVGQGEHYEFNMPQIRDLAMQSSSSFLLAIGPRAGGVTIPVVPARLFLDRFDSELTAKRLDIATVAANSRGLAEWLVDEVIGLWTGDPQSAAVNKAKAAYGDSATLLVRLDVRFIPLGPDEPVE